MSQDPAGNATQVPAETVRVSTLVGARLCTRCGFDLCGQPVVREPHYKMLMVRCPECAMVASLQEYPHRTRWFGRWTGFLSALWLLSLLAGALISAIILNVFCDATARVMVDHYAADITRAYGEYTKTLPTVAGGGYVPWQQQAGSPSADWWVDSVWFAGVADQTLASHGGALRSTHWPGVVNAIYDLPLASVIGALWAVALLHVKRRRVLMMIPALGLVCLLLDMLEWGRMGVWFGSNRPAYELAIAQIGVPARCAAMAVLMAGVGVGLWIGRPLARLAVRTFLPPRLWGSLSLLWTEEGLTPPSPVRP
jgi:hypothetical protein